MSTPVTVALMSLLAERDVSTRFSVTLARGHIELESSKWDIAAIVAALRAAGLECLDGIISTCLHHPIGCFGDTFIIFTDPSSLW